MKISNRAGEPPQLSDLVDVPRLIAAYYEERPDPHVPAQRVLFGTSGHRGNQGRKTGLSDGIVITPSHNPPECGGFKYNPPNGGPAQQDVTGWIESRANAFLNNESERRQTRSV
jgi:phosphoglucomutase